VIIIVIIIRCIITILLALYNFITTNVQYNKFLTHWCR